MEIEQNFTVPYPRDVVWACFRDTPGIVACLPGASLPAPPDDVRLKLAITVKLGPIVASFAGDGEMKLDDTAWRGSVIGGGVDRKSASRVKGEASFSLDDPTPRETRVDVKVDYAIAGSLAQFSRGGIVKELATRMTDAFAQNLKAKLDARQHAVGHNEAQSDVQGHALNEALNEAPDASSPSPTTFKPADAKDTLSAAIPGDPETRTMQAADTPNASTTGIT